LAFREHQRHHDAAGTAGLHYRVDRRKHGDAASGVQRPYRHLVVVVTGGQDRVDLGAVLAPWRAAVKGGADHQPRLQVVEATQPSKALRIAVFGELAGHRGAGQLRWRGPTHQLWQRRRIRLNAYRMPCDEAKQRRDDSRHGERSRSTVAAWHADP